MHRAPISLYNESFTVNLFVFLRTRHTRAIFKMFIVYKHVYRKFRVTNSTVIKYLKYKFKRSPRASHNMQARLDMNELKI